MLISIWICRKEIKYLKTKNNFDIVVFQKLDFQVHIDDWVAIAGACDGIIISINRFSSFCRCYWSESCSCNARRTRPMAFRFE